MVSVPYSKNDPRRLGAMCAACPFAKQGVPNKPVLGEGSLRPVGILVGEGPGREEAEVGRPFVGVTGRALDEELLRAGLLREKLFIVNATCCIPVQGKTEAQMAKAVECCRPALLKQLEQFDPETPVFAMGRYAYTGLTGVAKGVMAARGFVRENWKIPRGKT